MARSIPCDVPQLNSKFSLQTVCIIIGAMKAGTSSLFNWLAECSEICPSSVKEPYFFAVEEKYRQGYGAYFDLWAPQPGHKVALEASTDYTKFPYVTGVPERLKALEDSGYRIRLIYLMRHPVARLASHVRHLYLHHCDVVERPVPLAPLEAGLMDRFIAFSSYAQQLDQFDAVFDRSQLKLVSFERMIADPAAVVADVCRFLDLDTPNIGSAIHGEASNVSESIRTWDYLPEYYRFLTDVGWVKRRLSPLVPEHMKAKLRAKVARDYAFRVELTEAEKLLALERLKPDLVRLRDHWGFDVTGEWRIALSE